MIMINDIITSLMPRPRSKYPPAASVPASSDRRWEEWSRPLHKYLTQKPRSLPEIKRWAKRYQIRRFIMLNMLAWLENKKIVTHDPYTNRWRGHVLPGNGSGDDTGSN
jgi:hypothetical protein